MLLWLVLLSTQHGDLEKPEMYLTYLTYGYNYKYSCGFYVCVNNILFITNYKIQLFVTNTSQNKSQGKHGKIRGLLYDLNTSYIFCTYSQCYKMDKVKAINISAS